MAACVPVTNEKIRAEILMGNTVLARTPFVSSFNVNESRTQESLTFSVTFEMIGGTPFPLGEKLVIRAGTKGNLKTIMTGTIESTTAQPSFGKPNYFSVTLGGRGVLSALSNKTFSRRLKSAGQGIFCLITGGSANRPSGFHTLDKNVASGNHQAPVTHPNPAKKTGEHSPFIVYQESSNNQAAGGLVGRLAGRPTGADEGTGGGGGFRPHTHENLDEGGPAFGTYSVD